MRPYFYILDSSGEPMPCINTRAWGRWFDKAERRVAETFIGDTRVSTVFLGLDHNFELHGPPLLWETMVFGGHMCGYQARYASRAEAEAGHEAAVALVLNEEKPDASDRRDEIQVSSVRQVQALRRRRDR